ncbi:collagenase-like [Battus philenor]|uniref:collagenase-like n=1 Tax=Battus philenor TaxID=42288 RepID=UPI0035CF205C
MKVILVAIVLVLAVSVTYGRQFMSIEDLTSYDYHRRIGMPEAARIKKLEDEYLRSGNFSRIVGGSITDISHVPYQTGLVIAMNGGGSSLCGGVLISTIRVVTAAHCHTDGNMSARSFTVVLGSNTVFSGGVRITTSDIAPHPQWNPRLAENDIAVIRMRPVSTSNVIQPIELPSGPELNNRFVDYLGLASGYGRTANNAAIPANQRLSSVNLPILSDNTCRPIFGTWYHNTNICTSGAGGRGTCQGDSGGPLVVHSFGRRILVGIVSYGHSSGCSGGFPAVYARVTSYVNWIVSQ